MFLWRHLRNRQVSGCRFRRQQPIGDYIVDFVNLENRLIVEVDGGQHAESAGRDRIRDRFLAGQGYRVMRFWNHEVLTDIEVVLEVIRQNLPNPGDEPGG